MTYKATPLQKSKPTTTNSRKLKEKLRPTINNSKTPRQRLCISETKNSDNHEIYNLGRPFLGQYCFIHHLSDPCPSLDKKRRNSCHGVIKFAVLADSSLGTLLYSQFV